MSLEEPIFPFREAVGQVRGDGIVDITYSRMRNDQAAEVVALIRQLMSSYGTSFESTVTPESLRGNQGFLNIDVAVRDGRIIGLCAWTLTFSTWRGLRGMYIADHFVESGEKDSGATQGVLRFAARNAMAEGAAFIRHEVDITDEDAESLYSTIGFWRQMRHNIYFLEPSAFTKFVAV